MILNNLLNIFLSRFFGRKVAAAYERFVLEIGHRVSCLSETVARGYRIGFRLQDAKGQPFATLL